MKSRLKTSASGTKKSKNKYRSGKKFFSTAIKWVIIIMLIFFCAVAGLVGGAVVGYIKAAPKISYDEITGALGKTTFIYDSDGKIIARLTGKDNKDSEWVSYDDTTKFLRDAIISIEDERFESHNGVDIRGVINIGISYITSGGNPRGGSTITMQVVRNITGNTKNTLQRKVQEWYGAIQFEKKFTKRQILELYMNISYWGHSCYGVQASSNLYFGKDVSELTLAQSATLAGITNSPGTYNPFTEKGRTNAKERQKLILKKMLELGKITKVQYDAALVEDLKYFLSTSTSSSANIQSYFVDQVILDVKRALMDEKKYSSVIALQMIYNGGLKIYTTMDSKIQTAMDEVFTNDKYFPLVNKAAINSSQHPQAAMVILDSQNGQVKALYGGYGEKEGSNLMNRATMIQRQPGSTIKPIAVYAPAIDLKKVTPATIVDDVPVYLMAGVVGADPEKAYPTNYDGKYDGLTSIRNAIKASVNVVATKVWMNLLGPDNSINYLKKVGIDRPDEKYVSLVLGGLHTGVNTLQMAAAYVPFAHSGMYFEPTTFTKVVDNVGNTVIEKKASYDVVYSEQTAFIMDDMLKGVCLPQDSPYPHGGTAASIINNTSIGMTVAGKTGTTSDNKDKWFVGFTPYYVAATWYGYDNKTTSITLQNTEYSQAQLIWAAVMKKANENLPQKDFPVPTGLVMKKICIYSGKIATSLCSKDPRGNATRDEYFIEGTEPSENDVCKVHVVEKLCTASKDIWGRYLLAGSNCPSKTVFTKVAIRRLVPYTPTKPGELAPKDLFYEMPSGEYCTVHGR